MIYWTADDYHKTGCMNMLCPGFVLLSRTTTPGMVLAIGSIPLNISKDVQTGNWQVVVGDEIVGYFPKEIINGMSGATQVQMGGIVYAPPGQRSPSMGNGFLPVHHGGNYPAANFTWVSAQGAKIPNWTVARDVADANVYDATVTSDSGTGPEGVVLQYGGPGGQLTLEINSRW
ncbi:hypothetical protein E2562_030466 [Oryza meyeriana var. granulata]|uniref:Neprosin PEP catalytic domain-containing protein n=1 Tax=Oryza meyeriana var. granulata TaxID=110450 RepID=A0A6G1CJG7_9ORYZ|nr:hypothetical protein E2562_030466 [Oryza meyeriana var. granulata]